jgi:glycosyltransferase involved in cell wall biosynthesis
LVRAIGEVLENPARARELGSAGYKRVHANFTWQKAAEKTVAAYREVIRDYHRL